MSENSRTGADAAPVLEPEDYASKSLPLGQLLWHYTDFAGLQGVLNGEVWASSLRYLNDTAEFRYGIRIALEVLAREFAGAETHLVELQRVVDEFFTKKYTPSDLFVASFSLEEDDLSQWRAYGGRAAAFSIGFDPRRLEDAAASYLFELKEVTYEVERIKDDLLRELRDPIARVREAASEDLNKAVPANFAMVWGAALAVPLMVLAPRYKHPKFAAEREWRLIRRQAVVPRNPSLPHQFRLSGSLVVPYLALPLHKPATWEEVRMTGAPVPSPIAAIITGPSPHPDELVYAVGEMVARKGLALIDVRKSVVPFRNW